MTFVDIHRSQSLFADAIIRSRDAMQEIIRENFNSQTLRTLLTPKFRTSKPNTVMALSKSTHEPVEVRYNIRKNNNYASITIFPQERKDKVLGRKDYFFITDSDGNKKISPGYMTSNEEECIKADVMGIGIIEYMLQIKDAIENGIKSIPVKSMAKATLFNIKMGFLPVPQLKEVHTLDEIKSIINAMIKYSGDIGAENYTPIVVSEGTSHFLDINTTQCLADIRQIKKKQQKSRTRPELEGGLIKMNLDGENYEIWKKLISGETVFESVI